MVALFLAAAGMDVGLILAGGKAQWIGLVILMGAYPLTVVGLLCGAGLPRQTDDLDAWRAGLNRVSSFLYVWALFALLATISDTGWMHEPIPLWVEQGVAGLLGFVAFAELLGDTRTQIDLAIKSREHRPKPKVSRVPRILISVIMGVLIVLLLTLGVYNQGHSAYETATLALPFLEAGISALCASP